MKTTLDKTQLKAIITEALIDLLKHDREIFHEIVLEVIEGIGLVNAIKEAENDEDIDESKILEILDEARQLRNSSPTKGKPLSHSVIENRAEEAQENNCQFQDNKALLAAIAEENRQISDQHDITSTTPLSH